VKPGWGVLAGIVARTLCAVLWTVLVLAALWVTPGTSEYVWLALFVFVALVYYHPWLMSVAAVVCGGVTCFLCRAVHEYRKPRPYSEWLRS
jgi:hypothetical protein